MALLDCHAYCIDSSLPQPASLLDIELDQALIDQYLVKRLPLVQDHFLLLALPVTGLATVEGLVKLLRLALASLLDLAAGLSVHLGLHHRYIVEELEEGLAEEQVSADLLQS